MLFIGWDEEHTACKNLVHYMRLQKFSFGEPGSTSG